MKISDWLRLISTAPQKKCADGTALRLLTAQEMLDARREAGSLAEEDREMALCSNACLLARAWIRHGHPVYPTGEELLKHLTARQIQDLAEQWAVFDQKENPGLSISAQRLDALKKVWSICRGSACAGVCSGLLGRCRRKNGSKP